MSALAKVFWTSAGLLAYTHLGYPLVLAGLVRAGVGGVAPGSGGRDGDGGAPGDGGALGGELPSIAVIVAAYAEEAVIARRVTNLRELDYPRERLEIVVACDGSPDATAASARAAGADRVLELPRGGKIRAQDAAVAATNSELVAFSDANATWEADALRALVAPFRIDPRVGYVCGELRLLSPAGTNQEGLYWRYEMWVRGLESRVRSVTAGNGAIYATRREAYLVVDPIMGHDLSFPFNMVKRGWRAVFTTAARASEKAVPSIEGEFARKRRMMGHTWPIVVRGGMLSPHGYDPLYAFMIVSHRLLRYASPLLHLAALATSLRLAIGAGRQRVDVLASAAQLGLLAAAALASRVPARPLLIARYYVLTTASLAAGLWDWLAHGTAVGWEPAEGTR